MSAAVVSTAVGVPESQRSAPQLRHPRRLGWMQTTALAMGGSNQSLFLVAAIVLSQGSAAVPLLAIGLLLGWAAMPGWIELIMIWPDRVGGIAATCAEAFRPYSPVLANLTGVCYWWGWVPTCGLTALLSAGALHSLVFPWLPVSTPVVAIVLVLFFLLVNLLGVHWVGRLAIPVACASAVLAFASAFIPIVAGNVDWHASFDFHLATPFGGPFGEVTSAMAGLYLIGFAAPAFEAATCHVGETLDPRRNVPRAVFASAGMASVFFVLLPVVWLGVIGPGGLAGDLSVTLGPTFAPLLGASAKSAAALFLAFNMFHGTLQPLAGAARTLSQLAEDGLVPRILARRCRTDAPWVASSVTAGAAIVLLLAGDPTWMIAAANLTYLIGIGLPSIAVWLLRKHSPGLHRPFRAPLWTIRLGVAAAICWGITTVLGFEQFGLPTVLFGLALAYSGTVLYAWRIISDRRRAHKPTSLRSLHLKLTGAMLLVLTLDGAGYLLAVDNVGRRDPALISGLQDIFVAVSLLTLSVGLVLPGMIAHASGQVMNAAEDLAVGTLADLTRAMEALSEGRLDDAHARVHTSPVDVHSRDEIGAMATSFNVMVAEVTRAALALDVAREQLRRHTENLGELVDERTHALQEANDGLEAAQRERGRLMAQMVRVAEDERSRLAADLHDGPIQRLTTLALLMDRAQLRNNRGSHDEAQLLTSRAQDHLRTEISGLRQLMSGLRPPALDEGGLATALTDLAGDVARREGLGFCTDIRVDGRHRPETETVIYRVAQEALTNIGKHARARQVHLSLLEVGEELTLIVRDDGTGFVPGSHKSLVRRGHYGLAGMRERVELTGGAFEVTSVPGQGTTVVATIPTRLLGLDPVGALGTVAS